MNKYGNKYGYHTPARTAEFCELLRAAGIPFQDESWHNDATDRISLTGSGLCVWVGDPDADGYEQTELMTDDDDARTIAAGTFAEIITAIKNYSHA